MNSTTSQIRLPGITILAWNERTLDAHMQIVLVPCVYIAHVSSFCLQFVSMYGARELRGNQRDESPDLNLQFQSCLRSRSLPQIWAYFLRNSVNFSVQYDVIIPLTLSAR